MTWVLLNEAAHHHQGRQRWTRVSRELSLGSSCRIVTLDRAGLWRKALSGALAAGERLLLAAGGDGTVGALFDALRKAQGDGVFEDVTIGAVGLGSSNDFHKPFGIVIAGVPLRINTSRVARRDVVLVRYLDASGASDERCFAVSASVGVVARANALFNEGTGALGVLKARAPSLAIVAAALTATLTARNRPFKVTSGPLDRRLELTNLSIAKTRYLAGSLTYDTPVLPDDGRLSVNLCEGMSRWELIRTLLALQGGRFYGCPKTVSLSVPSVSVRSDQQFELELDGEVVVTSRADFRVLQHQARVCSC